MVGLVDVTWGEGLLNFKYIRDITDCLLAVVDQPLASPWVAAIICCLSQGAIFGLPRT